jgi:hypothetical protein
MARDKAKKARFFMPPNILKKKVGTGGLHVSVLEKAQKHIEAVEIDFVPYAKEFLKEFATSIKIAKESNDNTQTKKDALVAPIMQLKANGGMFKYHLVSHIADIAMQFIEEVEEINDDTVEILNAHSNTIKTIITNKLTGDGGKEGSALAKELDKACQRYFTKHKPKSKTRR